MQSRESQGAEFSPDRVHRYWLWRTLDNSHRRVAFIGLNPSIANEVRNDLTVSRCMGFAKEWGFGRFDMLNAFAFVATYPKDMRAAADPVGRNNDEWLLRITNEVDFVVAAWGNDGAYLGRGQQVRGLLHGVQLHHLGLTVRHHPRHPSRLPRGVRPEEWR
jgi:hypothetical protein